IIHMEPIIEQKHNENPGGRIVDEIFEIWEELKSKKLFRKFNSLRESVEILQKYKDEQFSEYQKISCDYEQMLYDIRTFANQLLSHERSFLRISYFINVSYIKREFEELTWKYEYHEKKLKSVMLTIVRKKEESKTEDFNTIYKILEDITYDNKSQNLNQIQEIVQRHFDQGPNKIPSTLLTDPPYKSNLNNDVEVYDKGSSLNIYNWAAPEMMQDNSFYTQKCEIFSFGMLLWELAYQKIPYKEKSAKEIRDYVIKG
ncbi:12980_t:CDS:2, partial [Gigaspora rosea]